MRKNLFISSLCIASTVLTVGCSSSDSDDNTGLLALALLANRSAGSVVARTPSNLPSKTTIDTPKSVSSASSSTTTSTRGFGKNSPGSGERAEGYEAIKMSVQQMNQTVLFGALEMLMLDSKVGTFINGSETTVACQAPGENDFVTFDAGFLAAIRIVMEAQGYTPAKIEEEIKFWNELVGTRLAIPAVSYQRLTNDPNGYLHQISYSYNAMNPTERKACPGQGEAHDFTIKLSADTKTKFSYGGKIVFDFSSFGGEGGGTPPSGDGGAPPEGGGTPPPLPVVKQTAPSTKITINFSITTDLNELVMVYTDQVSMGGTNFRSNLRTEACNKETFAVDSCWRAQMRYGGDLGEGLGKLKVDFTGRMDNNGGLISSTFTFGSDSNRMREQFTGDGTLTGLEFCTGATCTNFTPVGSFGAINAEGYDGFDQAPPTVAASNANRPTAIAFGTVAVGDSFVAAPGNPTEDPASIVGFIFVPSEGLLEVDYWGETSALASLKIYKMGFDSSGNPTYTEISDASLTSAQ